METSRITVYTCVTQSRETLRDEQNVEGADFVAFTDEPSGGGLWRKVPAYNKFRSPRRNARIHKILSHQFIKSEYSLWIDGNVSLRVPAHRLIDEWLADCDIATFLHRTRNCTYEEANVCTQQGLDDANIISAQMQQYRSLGLAMRAGLPETSVLLRRQTKEVEAFNNCWWSELCRYSVRDQLSFMHAVRSVGLRVRFVTPTKFENEYFSMLIRPAGIEKVGQ